MGFGNECYKGQRYDKLKKDLLKAGELFRDPEFPASQKSIFYSKTDPEIVWKRPTEICKLPKLVVEGGNCDDLQEGELGNRWFISACSSIANFKPLFDKVIPDVSTQTFSSYAGIFKFDFWYFGSWVEVVVDDFLPTKHGRLIFCHSTTKNEFWSALLEKAYAKLLGDYESLSAGLAVDALIDFTGGVSEWIKSAPKGDQDETNLFNHLKESLENKALVIAEIMDGGDVEETLPTAPEPGFEVDADVLLVAEIDQTTDTTAAVPSTTASISTPTKPKTTSTVRPTTSLIDRDGFVTDCGLYRCHGYNVRQITTVTLEGRSLNMVRLQSPWQGGEWMGDFSNVSPEMKILKPQEKEKLGLTFELESEFWMPFSDFCEQFNSFQICHFVNTSIFSIKKKYSESLLPGRWISSITSLDNRAGGAKHTNFTQNPQYLFEMSKPGTIMCSLEQNDRTVERMQDRNLTNEEIALGVYKVEDNRKYRIHSNKSTTIVASSGDPAKQRSVFTAQRLDQGRYIIIPATGRPNIEANFLLRFYSDVGSTAKEIDKHNPGKAGMCSSPPTMVVQIGIVRCDGLSVEKGDVNAFCTLKCDGQTVKTPVIKNNKDPEWNRLYIFYRKAGDKENPINIQVSNSGSISNTLIGEASISEFKPSHEKVTTQLIVKSKKKDQPDVQLGSTVEYRIYCTEDLNEL